MSKASKPTAARVLARDLIRSGRASFDGKEVELLREAAAAIGDAPQDDIDRQIVAIVDRQTFKVRGGVGFDSDLLPPLSPEIAAEIAAAALARAEAEKKYDAARNAFLLAYARSAKRGDAASAAALELADENYAAADRALKQANGRLNNLQKAARDGQLVRWTREGALSGSGRRLTRDEENDVAGFVDKLLKQPEPTP